MKSPLNFMTEDNGNFSAVRLFPTILTICMATDWMHAVFTVGKWSPNMELIVLVIGAITAKVTQKFMEEKIKKDE